MKIMMLADSLGAGGAETHIEALTKRLCACGHRVIALSSGGAVADRMAKFGAEHRKTPNIAPSSPKNARDCLLFIKNFLLARLQIANIIAKEMPDIVHAHTRKTAFLARSTCKKLKIPLVVTAHARFDMTFPKGVLSFFGDGLICVSEDIRDHLLKSASLRRMPSRVAVIFNGVEPSVGKVNSYSSPTEGGKRRVIFVSRLDGDCSLGAELLCELAPRLHDAFGGNIEIIIVGGGSEYPKIAQRSREINQKLNRKLINAVGGVDDPKKFFTNGALFVGVSRAALEAMASGLPVILCGNEGFLGLLSVENLAAAQKTNLTCRN